MYLRSQGLCMYIYFLIYLFVKSTLDEHVRRIKYLRLIMNSVISLLKRFEEVHVSSQNKRLIDPTLHMRYTLIVYLRWWEGTWDFLFILFYFIFVLLIDLLIYLFISITCSTWHTLLLFFVNQIQIQKIKI